MPQVGPTERDGRARPRRGGRRALRLAAVLALSLQAGGCAYFNTFYHARKYYAEGDRVRLAAETRGQVAANNEAYKKCIDKCKKLIEKYPDSKWQDDAHLLMAKAAYGRQDYLFAEATFKRFREKFPDSELLPEAIYWSGLTAYADEDYTAARSTWEDLLDRFPRYEDRESVEFYLAEASWKSDRLEEAARSFQDFLRRYPDGKRSTEARLELAQILMEDKQYEGAAEILGYIVSKGKVEEDRLAAQMLWGEVLEAQHKDEDALELYVNLELQLDPNVLAGRMDPELREQSRNEELARAEAARQDSLLHSGFMSDTLSTETDGDPANLTEAQVQARLDQAAANEARQAALRRNVNETRVKQLGQAMLREGSVLVRLERPWEAIEVFEQVASEFSQTPIASEAQYRIGYVNEVLLQDFAKAQEEYAEVGRHGQSTFREAADSRAQNLSTVRGLMAAAGDSLSLAQAAAAEARFMRAELYLFQQENPDRALEEYQAIESTFRGTDHAAKAGLAIAWLSRNSLGDSAAAMAKYAEVAEQYPGTEYGRRANQILYGPEREPDAEEFAGPTLEHLRDPENLALLSVEAEAALTKVDQDLAQAQAQREAERQAQEAAAKDGPPGTPPTEDEVLSLTEIVNATPGLRPDVGSHEEGVTGSEGAPGSEGVTGSASIPGIEGTPPGTEGVPPGTEDVPPGGSAVAENTTPPVNSGDVATSVASDPELKPIEDPDAPPAGAAANPVSSAAVTETLPADEPFFWERAGKGPNPLIPVTGAAPAPAAGSRGNAGTPPAEATDSVPGHLMRVPRGLYLDPLAVPDTTTVTADPKAANRDPKAAKPGPKAAADSTKSGEDR